MGKRENVTASLPSGGGDGDVLLPVGRVAAIFGVDRQSVTRWRRAGRLPSDVTTGGGHHRWWQSKCEWLARQERW